MAKEAAEHGKKRTSGKGHDGANGKKKRKKGGRGDTDEQNPPAPAPHEPEEDELSEQDLELVKGDPRYAQMIMGMHLEDDATTQQPSRKRAKPEKPEVEPDYERAPRRPPDEGGPQEDPGTLPTKTLKGDVVTDVTRQGRQGVSTVSGRSMSEEGSHQVDEDHVKPNEGDHRRDEEKTVSEKGKKKEPKEQKSQSKQSKGDDSAPQREEQYQRAKEALADVEDEEQRYQVARTKISSLSKAILASPEETTGHLNDLLDLCSDGNVAIARMARLSLFLVLKDIAPGYPIKLPAGDEQESKLSKRVQQVRDFERSLLNTYQAFLRHLEHLAGTVRLNTPNDHRADKDAILAIRCLAGFAKALPHFNFRTDVLRFIVPRLGVCLSDIAQEASSALEDIIRNDKQGESTLEIVKLVAELVKQYKCRVPPRVLEPLRAINFHQDLVLRKASEEKGEEKLSRKQKYKQKRAEREQERKERNALRQRKREGALEEEDEEEAELRSRTERDLKEAQALPDIQKRKQLQTLSLEALFEVFFRVLKTAVKENVDTSLLASALELMAEHVHLISVDYMSALMKSLRHLLQREDLSRVMRAHCLKAVNAMLSGEGAALNVDPQEFFRQLYLLWDEPVEPEEGKVLLELTQSMVINNKKLTSTRLAAFAKRLMSCALHSEPGVAMGAIAAVRLLLNRNAHVRILLDNEEVGVSKYDPNISDPDHSGARDGCLWEVSLMLESHHPAVTKAAKNIVAMPIEEAPAAAPWGAMSPAEVAASYDTSRGGMVPSPWQHSPKQQRKKYALIERLLRRGKEAPPSSFDT